MESAAERSREDRLDRERRRHNELYTDNARARLAPIHATVGESLALYWALVRAHASGDLLELGCGPDGAKSDVILGARSYTAIDISDRAVELAATRATAAGTRGAKFLRMDAEATDFESDSFDLTFGTGILHHLDLQRSLRELSRVLRPNGHAVFYEPLGLNPLINAYRARTPELRTEDEHPLVASDFETMRQYFRTVRYRNFHVFAPLTGLTRPEALRRRLVPVAERIDRTLLARSKTFNRFAWVTVILLEEPRAKQS